LRTYLLHPLVQHTSSPSKGHEQKYLYGSSSLRVRNLVPVLQQQLHLVVMQQMQQLVQQHEQVQQQ
jgi:hypothetical protein